MSDYTNLELEIVGHTAVLTLANPPANTLSLIHISEPTRPY